MAMLLQIKSYMAVIGLACSLFAFDCGAADEFEGVYRVGPTTCTVTPAKMAYEIRWKGGQGMMPFFYDADSPFGPFSFVSERKPDGFDRFVFTDQGIRTGTFIRSDGRRFPVMKLANIGTDQGGH